MGWKIVDLTKKTIQQKYENFHNLNEHYNGSQDIVKKFYYPITILSKIYIINIKKLLDGYNLKGKTRDVIIENCSQMILWTKNFEIPKEAKELLIFYEKSNWYLIFIPIFLFFVFKNGCIKKKNAIEEIEILIETLNNESDSKTEFIETQALYLKKFSDILFCKRKIDTKLYSLSEIFEIENEEYFIYFKKFFKFVEIIKKKKSIFLNIEDLNSLYKFPYIDSEFEYIELEKLKSLEYEYFDFKKIENKIKNDKSFIWCCGSRNRKDVLLNHINRQIVLKKIKFEL